MKSHQGDRSPHPSAAVFDSVLVRPMLLGPFMLAFMGSARAGGKRWREHESSMIEAFFNVLQADQKMMPTQSRHLFNRQHVCKQQKKAHTYDTVVPFGEFTYS